MRFLIWFLEIIFASIQFYLIMFSDFTNMLISSIALLVIIYLSPLVIFLVFLFISIIARSNNLDDIRENIRNSIFTFTIILSLACIIMTIYDYGFRFAITALISYGVLCLITTILARLFYLNIALFCKPSSYIAPSNQTYTEQENHSYYPAEKKQITYNEVKKKKEPRRCGFCGCVVGENDYECPYCEYIL